MCRVATIVSDHPDLIHLHSCTQTGFAFFFPFDPMGMRSADKELKELKVCFSVCLTDVCVHVCVLSSTDFVFQAAELTCADSDICVTLTNSLRTAA